MKIRLLKISLIVLLIILIVPGYLRAYRVLGDSDAPALVTGDRILVSFVSYDLRLPYIHNPALRIRNPKPGDMVLFKNNENQIVFKRVVAGPGTRISMEKNHLFIDGHPLTYKKSESAIDRIEAGKVFEFENGNGWGIDISYTPNIEAISDFEEITVPADCYYVLGSNRDLSEDSRHYGPVARDRILGKIIRKF